MNFSLAETFMSNIRQNSQCLPISYVYYTKLYALQILAQRTLYKIFGLCDSSSLDYLRECFKLDVI